MPTQADLACPAEKNSCWSTGGATNHEQCALASLLPMGQRPRLLDLKLTSWGPRTLNFPEHLPSAKNIDGFAGRLRLLACEDIAQRGMALAFTSAMPADGSFGDAQR